MKRLSTPAILARIDALLMANHAGEEQRYDSASASYHGTLTLVEAVYGVNGSHAANLRAVANEALTHHPRRNYYPGIVSPMVQGTLIAMKQDVENDLVGSIERAAIGEVIADMLALAKEALREGRDGSRNVAAVLAAAAFEDTMRKLGADAAGVDDRRDLSLVLQALKKADVLVGAPAVTAQSYLKFRNDALHADWEHIDASVVSSVISFTEQQVLLHFS